MSTTLKFIPLSRLQASKLNVRKTGRFAGIKDLAASILEKDLLENLVVRPLSARENGVTHEVTAGGRRLAALQLLAKRKKIAPNHPVRCLVRQGEERDAVEDSLAENFMRADLHPADQFEAFARLAGQGLSSDEIGARFGVTPTFVAQRLKLASVSPRLIALYRKAAMTLEQLTAFVLSDDHKVQEEVWFGPYTNPPAHMIRRLLTSTKVAGSDRRARFIGAKAYEAAGGIIDRDLFAEADEGYFRDSQLLDRLVAEHLEEAARPIRDESWQWVEVHSETDYDLLSRFGRAQTVDGRLSRKEKKRLASLARRYDERVAELEEGQSDTELDRLSAQIDALVAKRTIWPETEKAHAGVIVSLGPDGVVHVVRGLVRPGGESSERKTKTRASREGYADVVLLDLSAHRTAALREVLAAQPKIALIALLHALVGRLFFAGPIQNCIKVSAAQVELDRASKTAGTGKAAQEFLERHMAWTERLPEPDALWDWLLGLSNTDRDRLLAHCVAMTVNALHGTVDEDVERLARTLGIDMAKWWRPTRENFFARLTKAEILTAIGEGASDTTAKQLADAKKNQLAAEAERLLAPTVWLPAPLRTLPGAAE